MSVRKQSSSAVSVRWSRPNGAYDSISLVCVVNGNQIVTDYDNKQIDGVCAQKQSISGLAIDVYTVVKRNQKEYVASNVFNYVVGKQMNSYFFF